MRRRGVPSIHQSSGQSGSGLKSVVFIIITSDKQREQIVRRQVFQRLQIFGTHRDTLVVTRLDRLARSTWHLCQIAEVLARKRVHLHVLDESIDTSDATGRLLFHMLGAIAQFETELRAERQREGIQQKRKSGIDFGRQKKLTPAQTRE